MGDPGAMVQLNAADVAISVAAGTDMVPGAIQDGGAHAYVCPEAAVTVDDQVITSELAVPAVVADQVVVDVLMLKSVLPFPFSPIWHVCVPATRKQFP